MEILVNCQNIDDISKLSVSPEVASDALTRVINIITNKSLSNNAKLRMTFIHLVDIYEHFSYDEQQVKPPYKQLDMFHEDHSISQSAIGID